MKFFRRKKRQTPMDVNPFGTFKYKDLKEMQEVFEHIPGSYVASVHDLFYFAALGLLGAAGTPQYDEMMEAFQEFLGKCEVSARAAVSESEDLLARWRADGRSLEQFKKGMPN